MITLKTSRKQIYRVAVRGLFFLAGLHLAFSASADELSLIVVSKSEKTDVCINLQDQCSPLSDGEFFSPNDSFTVKGGPATIFSTQAKEVFDLVAGTYRAADLLIERQTEENDNRLKTLMSVNSRATSSFSTRQSDIPICTSSPIKARWLNNCKLESVLPDSTDQSNSMLQLPEHAFYTNFPVKKIEAALVNQSSSDVFIIASQGVCSSLKSQSINKLVTLFEDRQAISILTPGKFAWIQHDILTLPDQCQAVFEKALNDIESSPGPDRTLKKYELFERFSLKYEALEALKQPVTQKPPVY